MSKKIVVPDPLTPLKQFTAARIAIGRAGTSIPIKETLQFKLAHAHARDAVYSVLDTEGLVSSFKTLNLPVLHLHSKALSRHKYLKRPDHGRQLDEVSEQQLKDHNQEYDIAIVIADGLSAEAVNENAVDLLKILVPKIQSAKLKIAPLCLVEQGRVAVGDDIGFGLNAKLLLILIGERPGLSAADSMGAYLTYGPRPGLTDESRNCISNIRPQGLKAKPAAEKIFYLVMEAFKRKFSGIALKDDLIIGAIGH
ncbi:ethanolamine ammonia-lyase subunit EutC [Mucilaginibacter gotjawali]|uniref:Ethanolamine ammonia-lyase small subunit n=2 Tax=Mucilaginibacter gotjawali TaxID=1550579 RepID=A0A839SB69_9SPHI|nr:ethanolamine ammonia-lyase subunit EutC [Mucilaginibacter gotjawali]MBB3054210.1 ethanolamine ammonia-lyase small subunit [Mucilaginibacter gotjawali]BAU54482.1 Ethanolamine ammonia-lyase light chain [Mucilaginibacter gotjawali]